VANVILEAFIVKQKVSDKDYTLVSSSHFLSLTFIDLNYFSNEDVSLLMSSNMNVFSSFLAPILNVYLVEDVP
jgi:hypothetical protein